MADVAVRGAPIEAAHPVQRDARFPTWNVVVPLLLFLAALFLRLHAIDHESLWLDEGYTLLFSGMSLPRLILVGGAHEHPPLYYLLVHLIMLVDHSYLAPRYISAVSGALSVAVLYLLGRRLFGAIAGVLAACLLAISPFNLWYGQDGRGYELAGLFVLLSYLCLLYAVDSSRLRLWLGYSILTAACLYTEYTTVFVLLPQVVLLLPAARHATRRPLLLSWGAVGLLFLPWIGVVSADAAGIASDYWIPAPTPAIVGQTVLEFLGLLTPCPSPPCRGHLIAAPLLGGNEAFVALAAALIAVAVLALALALRRWQFTVVAGWLLLPFVLVLALASRRSLYLDRIFLDATFALYLVLGAGLAAAWRRRSPVWLAVLGIVVVLVSAASVANLGPLYAGGVNPDWRSAARDFRAAYRRPDSVVFEPGVLRTLLAAYLPAGWSAARETPLWSRAYLDVPGWQRRFPPEVNSDQRRRLAAEAAIRDVQLTAAARHAPRVWLITENYSGMSDSRRWFTEHGYQLLLSELYAGDTRIELWSRSTPSSIGPPVAPDTAFAAPWQSRGRVRHLPGGVVQVDGTTTLTRSYPVAPGQLYSTAVQFRAAPPASKPVVLTRVFDAAGHLLDVFPRTQWYDWPVNGVWLQQPFGFVAPPGATRAVLSLHTQWGEAFWRNVAVYRQR